MLAKSPRRFTFYTLIPLKRHPAMQFIPPKSPNSQSYQNTPKTPSDPLTNQKPAPARPTLASLLLFPYFPRFLSHLILPQYTQYCPQYPKSSQHPPNSCIQRPTSLLPIYPYPLPIFLPPIQHPSTPSRSLPCPQYFLCLKPENVLVIFPIWPVQKVTGQNARAWCGCAAVPVKHYNGAAWVNHESL